MPPKRKRKSHQNAGSRKKGNEEEDGVLQRTPSSTSSDRVYLISPPPNARVHLIMESTVKRRGRRAKKLPSVRAKGIREAIDLLRKNMQPMPIPQPPKSVDWSKHEDIFRKLGLWEFALLEMEQDMKLDELTQLVATYDPSNRASMVKHTRIRVSRVDLAKALRLPHRKDKIGFEFQDSEGNAARPIDEYPDEVIRDLLYFISTRVCPSDDPRLTTEQMAALAESAVKSDQSVDWAALIWSRSERELLQGGKLEKFYYASHFQQLIKFQKPQLLSQDLFQTALEEEEGVTKTRAVDELGDLNPSIEVAIEEGGADLNPSIEVAIEEGGAATDHNQTEGSEQKVDLQENGNGPACDEGAVGPGNSEENEEIEALEDEMEADSEENMLENTLRPCSLQGPEIKVSEDGSKDSAKLKEDSESKAGPVEVSSQVAPLVEPTLAESGPSENEKSAMLNAVTQLEKSTSAEHLLSEIENAMLLNPTIHHEQSTSAEPQISEIEKDMMLNTASHFEKPTSAEHLLGGIEKAVLLNAGPSSHCGNARKRETEEEDALHGERDKKLRPDIAWHAGNFEMCMEHVYEWGRRAEQMHVAEKESVISRANIEIQQLSEQLQHRDYLIRTLQIGKQEQLQREMEFNKLNTEFVVTNETLRGYIKAFSEAKHTMMALQGDIAAANNTIEILKGQLQHEQAVMTDLRSLKAHADNFSHHMEATFEKLTTDIEKGMQNQERLEQQLSVLKAELKEKQTSACQ